MTDEELEKEAEEYAYTKVKDRKGYNARWELVRNAYIASAEPREKQIQIDAEHIRALQKQNGELTDKVKELEAEVFFLKDSLNHEVELHQHAEEYIKSLEAQIEKMKVKWHDLEKDPNDLPKDCKTMCICLGDFGSKYQPVPQVYVGYYDSLGWSDYMGSSLYSTVRYWCELPQF